MRPCQPRPPARAGLDPRERCPRCNQKRVLLPSAYGRLCVECRHKAQREGSIR